MAQPGLLLGAHHPARLRARCSRSPASTARCSGPWRSRWSSRWPASLVLSLTFVPAATAPRAAARRTCPSAPPLLVRWIETGVPAPLLRGLGDPRPGRSPSRSVVLLARGRPLLRSAPAASSCRSSTRAISWSRRRAPPDISLETAVSEAGKLEAVLLEDVPEVRQVVSRIGSPAVATDIMGLEQADVFVAAARRGHQWRPGLDARPLIAEIDRGREERQRPAPRPGLHPAHPDALQRAARRLGDRRHRQHLRRRPGQELDRLAARRSRRGGRQEPGAADVRVLAPPDGARSSRSRPSRSTPRAWASP